MSEWITTEHFIQTVISWYYRLAQLSHIVFSVLSIHIILIYTFKFATKHILPFNVRFLVNLMVLLMLIHSIDMTLIHTHHIFNSFHVDSSNPCTSRFKVSFCAPFRNTFSFCTLGLAVCQYCVYIDRLLCAFWKGYIKNRNFILVVLILKWFLLTCSAIKWVYRHENPDSYLLSCLNIPLESIIDLSLVTAAVFPINVICCFLSVVMFRFFKRKETLSRFEINSHFSASVDVDSSEFLYYVTRTQAMFIAVFPVFSISMRLLYHKIPRQIHLTFATLSYIFSLYCLVVPLVMLDYGRKAEDVRRAKIQSHLSLKSIGTEGANNYFGMVRSQWA